MGYFPHGAVIAAHQARKRQQEQEEEELLMTKYTSDELDGNWEFKIVRSETGAFRRPEIFQMLLQEESIAGWELVEKLDDRRVRFKRRAEARRKDVTLPPGVDPYRSTYGNVTSQIVLIISLALLLAGGIGFAVIASATGDNTADASAVIMPAVVMVFVLVVMIIVAIQRRR